MPAMGGLCDAAGMVGPVGTEQESGEVSEFARDRETAGRAPNMVGGAPTTVEQPATQLLFVPSRPSSRVSISRPSVSGKSESKRLSNLVTVGCAVGFESAPGQRSATYENHETNHGESNEKHASEGAKQQKPHTPT